MISKYIRWVFSSAFVVISCSGMGGLCVSMRHLKLQVEIPERVNSEGEKLSLVRHLEPEAIAEMRWIGEVHKEQLHRILPPQDCERVEQAFEVLAKKVTRSVWHGETDWETLPERAKLFVKRKFKELISAKVRRTNDDLSRDNLFKKLKTKPDWMRLLCAREFFLSHNGQDIGEQVGLSSIGKFSTDELVKHGILPVDWFAYRPEELRCKDYMIDFVDKK